MRKLCLLIAAALTAGTLVGIPLTAAEASSKYRVSIKLKKKLVDVSSNSRSARRTTFSGRVKGGPVKGKRIRVTAYNTSNNNKKYKTYSLKLSSKGRFSRTFEPPVGGVWRLTAQMTGNRRTATGTRSTHLDAFHWTFVHEFYDRAGRLNQPIGIAGIQHKSGQAAQWRVRGQRFNDSAFLIAGGNTAVVDIRGYKCKKINFKVGVEDGSDAVQGQYKIFQPSTSKGDRVIKTGAMRRGQQAYDAYHSRQVRDLLLPTRQLHFKVYRPSSQDNVDFLIGNAKVFCTFPSIN
ncbi:hypothetical protein [Aeromicrobium sp. P5_D10]